MSPRAALRESRQRGVLSRLSLQDFQALRAVSKTIEFSSGTVLIMQGSTTSPVLLVQSGIVKVVRTALPDSPPMIVDILGAGDLLGVEDCIIGKQSHVSHVATKPGTAFEIQRASFTTYLAQHPRAMALVNEAMLHRLRQRDATLAFATHKVQDRLLGFLARQARVHGQRVGSRSITLDLGLSVNDIASAIGASAASVNDQLVKLRKDKVLRTGYKTIHLDEQLFQEVQLSPAQSLYVSDSD